MHATMLCLAMVTLGIEGGWRPLPDGGFEYTIQIEPHMLDELARGEALFSDVPPKVRDVRSYRIIVGTGKLPQEGGIEPALGDRPPAGESVDGAGVTPPLATPPLEDPGGAPAFPGAISEPAPTPDPQQPPDDPPGPSAPGVSASVPWDRPRTLPAPTDSQPLPEFDGIPAHFVDQQGNAARPRSDDPQEEAEATPSADAEETGKPPAPFTLVLAGFLGSFGGMLYTGWLAWEYRRRYRTLLERMIGAGPGSEYHGEREVSRAGSEGRDDGDPPRGGTEDVG